MMIVDRRAEQAGYERKLAEARRVVEDVHEDLRTRLRCYAELRVAVLESRQREPRAKRIARYNDTYAFLA